MKTNKSIFFIALLMAISNLMSAQLKEIAYSDNQQKLLGFVAKPENASKKKSGILILPAWMGIDDHAKESAERLAKLGYYAFVADIYGVGNAPTNFSEAGQKAGYYKKNIKEYQTRIALALQQLIQQGANANEIVVMGYCFGGTGAIEAARANMNIKGVVSFHGGLARDASRTIEPIHSKVLILHGADDPYESETEIKSFQEEMRKANADWQMVYYANAVHSFTDKNAGNDASKGAAYNENAEKRSWKAMLQFLDETL